MMMKKYVYLSIVALMFVGIEASLAEPTPAPKIVSKTATGTGTGAHVGGKAKTASPGRATAPDPNAHKLAFESLKKSVDGFKAKGLFKAGSTNPANLDEVLRLLEVSGKYVDNWHRYCSAIEPAKSMMALSDGIYKKLAAWMDPGNSKTILEPAKAAKKGVLDTSIRDLFKKGSTPKELRFKSDKDSQKKIKEIKDLVVMTIRYFSTTHAKHKTTAANPQYHHNQTYVAALRSLLYELFGMTEADIDTHLRHWESENGSQLGHRVLQNAVDAEAKFCSFESKSLPSGPPGGTGTKTDTKTETSTDTGSETKTETETGSETKTDTGTRTEPGTKTKTDTGTGGSQKTKTDTGTKTKTDTGTKTGNGVDGPLLVDTDDITTTKTGTGTGVTPPPTGTKTDPRPVAKQGEPQQPSGLDWNGLMNWLRSLLPKNENGEDPNISDLLKDAIDKILAAKKAADAAKRAFERPRREQPNLKDLLGKDKNKGNGSALPQGGKQGFVPPAGSEKRELPQREEEDDDDDDEDFEDEGPGQLVSLDPNGQLAGRFKEISEIKALPTAKRSPRISESASYKSVGEITATAANEVGSEFRNFERKLRNQFLFQAPVQQRSGLRNSRRDRVLSVNSGGRAPRRPRGGSAAFGDARGPVPSILGGVRGSF